MSDQYKNLKINFSEFNLKPEYFDHPGWLHGTGHVYRVMCLVLKLGSLLKYNHETKLAFFAAYIHDMSRLHDGKCSEHGQRAADNKLPLFLQLFKNNGMNEEDVPFIYTAVANHSFPSEIAKDHPHYIVTAILKDADALDRIRINPDDLKLKYLRFSESITLIAYAEEIFYLSQHNTITSFEDMLKVAENIKI
jgi:hypothetical protein